MESKQQQKLQIHAVLFPFPALGHILPSLLLAQRLLESGIAVVFVTLKDRLPRVYQALEGFEIQADGDGDGDGASLRVAALQGKQGDLQGPSTTAATSTGHDSPDSFYALIDQCSSVEAEFEEMLLELKRASAPGSRWCIVSDNLLGWTQDVANRQRISRYLFFPSPACILAGVFHVRALRDQARLPLPSSTPQARAFVEIPGMPVPIETNDMHNLLLEHSPPSTREFYVKNSLRVHEADGILINTMEALEAPALSAIRDNRLLNPESVPVLPVGPLLPREEVLRKRARDLEEQCMVWLSKQPPRSVVYVSFGSIAQLGLDQIEELAFGLEASKQRFLWVLRSPDCLPEGKGVLPEGFRGELGLVVRDTWVPQLAILEHESTAVFVTHCGWNSTIESVCMGVPMLTLPFFADQALNSKMVVEALGIGRRLSGSSRDQLSRHKIEGLIKRAMQEPRYKIRELKAAAKKAAEQEPDLASFMARDRVSLHSRVR